MLIRRDIYFLAVKGYIIALSTGHANYPRIIQHLTAAVRSIRHDHAGGGIVIGIGKGTAVGISRLSVIIAQTFIQIKGKRLCTVISRHLYLPKGIDIIFEINICILPLILRNKRKHLTLCIQVARNISRNGTCFFRDLVKLGLCVYYTRNRFTHLVKIGVCPIIFGYL